MRVFVNNKRLREMIKKFLVGSLSKNETNFFLSQLQQYQSTLTPLFRQYIDNGQTHGNISWQEKQFLNCIAADSPVSALLHYDEKLFDYLREMIGGQVIQPACREYLNNFFPSFHTLVSGKDKLPEIWREVLREMIVKCRKIFDDRDCQPLQPATELHPKTEFFPAKPKCVERGCYTLDAQKYQNKCTKNYMYHATLTNGIVSMSCSHGVCYGFKVIEEHESVNHVFSLLRTRFHLAPKYIIYDNCCNLYDYCLNRDPVFFRHSWFLVDRLHWKNHSACCGGFNMSAYPKLRDLNSQIAEQRHSQLVKLKSSLSYMSMDNFIRSLGLFTWFRNCLKNARTGLVQYNTIFQAISPVYAREMKNI